MTKLVPRSKFQIGGLIKRAARWVTDPEYRTANSYSKDDFTFSQAYQDARSKGQRTFVWDGKYYNTDYSGAHHKQYLEDLKSGKAQRWETKYPNYTNPELRKAKQEELDLYGITNEQTRNKTFIQERARNNITPAGYKQPFKQFWEGIIKNNIVYTGALPDGDNTPLQQWDMFLGYPTSGFSISKYRPNNAQQDYYYHQINSSPVISNSMIPSFIKKATQEVDKAYTKVKQAERSGKREAMEEAENNFLRAHHYRDSISKGFSTSGTYYINDRNIVNNLTGSNVPYVKGNHIVSGDWLGDYTLGIGDNYISYYDEWDINPFTSNADRYGGKSNKKYANWFQNPINTIVGTPFHLYNRAYSMDEPNIDEMYKQFK